MITLFKKKTRLPIPAGAEIVSRKRGGEVIQVAKWVDLKGHARSADVGKDGRHVIIESDVWYCRLRDADGLPKRVSTGFTDKQVAAEEANKMQRQAEEVRQGLRSHEQVEAVKTAKMPLSRHIEDYLDYLSRKLVRGRRVSDAHVGNVRRQLERLAEECHLRRLMDITRDRVQAWIHDREEEGIMGARTINIYRASILAFVRWAVGPGRRMTVKPLVGLAVAEQGEPRRRRRPLNETELARLLDVARARPLCDAMRIRRGPRNGQLAAKVSDAERVRLEQLGRERRLMYFMMCTTGLRKGELGKMVAGDLHLDEGVPYVQVQGKNAKSGKTAQVPLKSDLVLELKVWLADKLLQYNRLALVEGRRDVAKRLPADTKVFNVPKGLVRILNRDLKAAKIPKKDADGRTVDVHAMRGTFATILSRAGVSPRKAQDLLRHSSIDLTMSTYTTLEITDTAPCVEALPSFSQGQAVTQVATGTDDEVSFEVSKKVSNGVKKGAEDQAPKIAGCPQSALHEVGGNGMGFSQVLDGQEEKKPVSSSDTGCLTAGDRIRTDDVQLGKLAFYH